MTSWYLNKFLASWRKSVDHSFPHRGKASDGTVGDARHQAESFSEHNPDPDGSVDAWDCDANLLGSSTPTGTAAEQKCMYALLGEFQNQPQAQLWIYRGQIANRDVQNWKRRPYSGANKHDKHAHMQSRSSTEKQAYTGDLDKVVDAVNGKPSTAGPKPGSRTLKKGAVGTDVAYLQRWLGLTDDGAFGTKTEAAVKKYQHMRGITADGVVGPATWRQMGVL